MPTRIGNNSFPGSFERQRIYIPWGLLDTLPWHNTRTTRIYVRGTRLRPGMYALNVRVQDRPEIPSHKDQDQEYSVALHHPVTVIP